MEDLAVLSIGIIFLLTLWKYVWKPAVLRMHIAIITDLFDKAYDKLEYDRNKIKKLENIYNKAANTPRDFDFYEFMIIINDIRGNTTKHTDKDYIKEDALTIEFANNCAKSMYVCLRMRSAYCFTHDIYHIACIFIKYRFKGGLKKMLNSIDETSSKDFLAHN